VRYERASKLTVSKLAEGKAIGRIERVRVGLVLADVTNTLVVLVAKVLATRHNDMLIVNSKFWHLADNKGNYANLPTILCLTATLNSASNSSLIEILGHYTARGFLLVVLRIV
jgi:formylmethanofuran dehydrogenase subunit B